MQNRTKKKSFQIVILLALLHFIKKSKFLTSTNFSLMIFFGFFFASYFSIKGFDCLHRHLQPCHYVKVNQLLSQRWGDCRWLQQCEKRTWIFYTKYFIESIMQLRLLLFYTSHATHINTISRIIFFYCFIRNLKRQIF